MVYFTADLHLGHARMIAYADRPFATAAEMDERLIAGINDRVAADDELWVLGDFAIRAKPSRIRRYRERIACRHVHLVSGNHDTHLGDDQWPDVFESYRSYYDGLRSPHGQRIVMCHYPISSWNGQRRGAYMLHGHIHSRGAAYNDANADRGRRIYDVGVDANGYAPVSMVELEARLGAVEVRVG